MTDPPLDQWLARLQAAQPAEVLLRLTNLEAQQTTSTVALAALAQKIHDMEVRMSATEDAIAELNTETNSLADRLDVILARETALDATTAGEIQAVSARLKGLAADPANPVPADEPAPGDGTAPVA